MKTEDTRNPAENNKPEKNVREGGLYGKVRMSVKAANVLVLVLLAALVGVSVFVIKHNGFTVNFDTDGGSQIESVKAYHSERLNIESEPVKEGYVFTGWYRDRACTALWDETTDTVTQSMTLYAGWEKRE